MTNSPRYQVRKALGGWYVEDTSTFAVWTGLAYAGAVSLASRKNLAMSTSNTSCTLEGAQDQQLSWVDMAGTDFDENRRPVQGALFQEPDAFGTLDLFDAASE